MIEKCSCSSFMSLYHVFGVCPNLSFDLQSVSILLKTSRQSRCDVAQPHLLSCRSRIAASRIQKNFAHFHFFRFLFFLLTKHDGHVTSQSHLPLPRFDSQRLLLLHRNAHRSRSTHANRPRPQQSHKRLRSGALVISFSEEVRYGKSYGI